MSEQIRQAFDASQERKYKTWATHIHSAEKTEDNPVIADTRSEEQIAFDTYTGSQNVQRTQAYLRDPDGNTVTSGTGSNFGLGTSKLSTIKTGYYLFASKGSNILESAKLNLPQELQDVQGYGTIEHYPIYNSKSDTDHYNTYVQRITMGEPVSVAGNMYTRGYVSATNTWSPWKKLNGGSANITAKVTQTTTLDAGQDATASVTKVGEDLQFKFGIPKGKDGTGGGGGGGLQPDVPNVPKNKDYATIRGEFGTNLIDYRELSRDNHIKVNGKVFYLDNTRKLLESSDKLKALSLYNRLRAGDASATHNITFKSKLIESSDKFYAGARGTNKLQIKLYKRQLSGEPVSFKDIIFTNDTSSVPSGHPNDTTKLDYKDNYSYISVDMGGDSVPAKGKIYLSAYYGDIEPKGLSQKFEFKNYNGFELKKNFKGTSDEYIHSTWYDKLKIRLGLLNLKDAEFVKVSEGETNNTILVKVPKDLWIPERYFEEHQAVLQKDFNDNLMTSNLCDIYQKDDKGDVQTKPFFIKGVTEEIDKKGHPVKCFNILIGKQYMSRWREHLSETQILYPVQDPSGDKFVQLPVGGLIFTLNSGQSIETNKFSKIENYKLEQLKTRGLIFKDSPFGYQDVVIDADNITSVVTNTVPQQVVPISIFK